MLLNSGLLLALSLAVPSAGPALATVIVGTAGLCTPPLEAGLRALWRTVLSDPGQRRAVLALDTGTQGLLYIVGPLLVAALASAHGPAAALIATATLGLIGTTVVASAPPSRRWRPESAKSGVARRRLTSPGLVLLFLALTCVGFAIGAMNVRAVALAEAHQIGMLAGLGPAVFSTGSFFGGLIYGRRSWPGSVTRHLLCGAAAFLVGWLPLLLLTGPYGATAAVAVPGAFLTLVVACAYMTTDTLTPAGRTSEAYAW